MHTVPIADLTIDRWLSEVDTWTRYLFISPAELSDVIWPVDEYPVIEECRDVTLSRGPSALVAQLTSQYPLGQPYARTLQTGFEVEVGKYKSRHLILRRYNNISPSYLKLTNPGSTWRIMSDKFTARVLLHLAIRNILQNTQFERIVPEIITVFRTEQHGYILCDYSSQDYKLFKSEIDDANRQLINRQLNDLVKFLTDYQWYDRELLNSLYIVSADHETSYELRYLPSSTCEIKYKLPTGQDISITPYSRPHYDAQIIIDQLNRIID